MLHYELDAFILADRHDACDRLLTGVSAIDRESVLLEDPSALKIRAGREHHLVDEDRSEPGSLESLLLGDEVQDLLMLVMELGALDDLAELDLLHGDPVTPVDLPQVVHA